MQFARRAFLRALPGAVAAGPIVAKAAADAVLYHARHFGDFHSPDLTPVESKQVECSSKIKISHDEARKRIESVVRSNRSNERP